MVAATTIIVCLVKRFLTESIVLFVILRFQQVIGSYMSTIRQKCIFEICYLIIYFKKFCECFVRNWFKCKSLSKFKHNFAFTYIVYVSHTDIKWMTLWDRFHYRPWLNLSLKEKLLPCNNSTFVSLLFKSV